MSTAMRDVMIEYIEDGDEHEVIKSISPRPKDKCLVSNGTVSNEHLSDQNGSHVIIEQISINGSYSQKNGFHIPSEETSHENYPTKDGVLVPSFQMGTYGEPLKLNDSSVLDKVDTSNGNSNMSGLQTSSVEDVCSEKRASNGLGIHYAETACVNDLAKGGGAIENKLQISKQINISNGKCEAVSDLLSINNPSNIPDSVLKQDLDNRQQVINWQNTVIEQQKAIIEKQDAVIEDQVLALNDANRHKEQLKRDLEIMDLVTEKEADLKSVAGKGVSIEPLKLYKEQLSQGLNSSQMQSKMNKINNLIESLVASSLKPPTSTVGEEIKSDSHEHGLQIGSEGESKSGNDELTLPKRKSELSDSEDPEELQLLAKKPKISPSVSTAQQQRSKNSQSCTRDEFRVAYAKYLQKYPAESNKEFNFSEEFSKEKSRLAKQHLDDIADRVLNAMSLDEYFYPKEMKENSTAVTVKPGGFHPKKELASRFEKESYDFGNFYTYLHHPLVRESCSKTIEPKTSDNSCLRKSSHQDAMDSKSSETRLETCDTFPWTLTKLIELFKSIILLNSFFPFLVIGYIITQFLNLFNRSEKNSAGSKLLSRQQRKD